MIKLTIDNKTVEVPDGTTIIEAARDLDIHIPTLCFAADYKPSASCMVCVVHIEGVRSLVPACATKATEGMVVTTQSNEIQNARKSAIELLLSDHVGDCLGPCQKGCPAGMNIPKMIRQIEQGQLEDAIVTIKQDIPLPAVLGRICSAPCEKVCRRTQADASVSICLLKRFAADVDLASEMPYNPACAETTGKKVAVIGAGPCGLSAAYYLAAQGIECTLYDDHAKPGGTLRYDNIDPEILPPQVLEKEINLIFALPISFEGNIRVGKDVSWDEIVSQYDAVLIASGDPTENDQSNWPVELKDNKIQVDRQKYTTSKPGLFAAGACIGSRKMAIRAIADGKQVALSIQSFLVGGQFVPNSDYNHRIGRLQDEEITRFLQTASESERIKPDDVANGYTVAQAKTESARCLHCDCRKADNCMLRNLATELDARQRTWQGSKNLFEQIISHQQIIFEPGKCIKCGLCIQAAQKQGESTGLSFQGRGFQMQMTVPLEKTFADGLSSASKKCVEICPTGALTMNKTESESNT